MQQISTKEKAGMIGRHILREHPAGTVAHLNALIADGKKDEALAIIKGGKVVMDRENLIMQAANYGKDIIIQRLCGVNTYSLNILWGEIGTSQTAPAITDTALGAPIARTAVALAVDNGYNTAQLQFFFPDSTLTNVTYYEAGTFVDGSSSIGSGQIFNHALFSVGYTKAAGTDITYEMDLTIN